MTINGKEFDIPKEVEDYIHQLETALAKDVNEVGTYVHAAIHMVEQKISDGAKAFEHFVTGWHKVKAPPDEAEK